MTNGLLAHEAIHVNKGSLGACQVSTKSSRPIAPSDSSRRFSTLCNHRQCIVLENRGREFKGELKDSVRIEGLVVLEDRDFSSLF
jgi:hypothetical protein